jgi:hypothetical protein
MPHPAFDGKSRLLFVPSAFLSAFMSRLSFLTPSGFSENFSARGIFRLHKLVKVNIVRCIYFSAPLGERGDDE